MFRAGLDQIVDPKHVLAKHGRQIDWRFLEGRFAAVYSDKPGQPPLYGTLTSSSWVMAVWIYGITPTRAKRAAVA